MPHGSLQERTFRRHETDARLEVKIEVAAMYISRTISEHNAAVFDGLEVRSISHYGNWIAKSYHICKYSLRPSLLYRLVGAISVSG